MCRVLTAVKFGHDIRALATGGLTDNRSLDDRNLLTTIFYLTTGLPTVRLTDLTARPQTYLEEIQTGDAGGTLCCNEWSRNRT